MRSSLRLTDALRLLPACAMIACVAGEAATTSGSDSSATSVTSPEDTGETALSTPGTDTTGPTTTACPTVDFDTTTVLVTDIDETLTTSDNEWLLQVANPSHDPKMRPDADTLMNAWFDLGYRIVYLTARGQGLKLLDGTPARAATEDWLTEHGFPFRPEDVYLADGVGAIVNADGYKEGVLQDLHQAGVQELWAYGNADTDIMAYKSASIPDDHIFLVGTLAGQFGVNPIPTPEAYTQHLHDFMPGQPCASPR